VTQLATDGFDCHTVALVLEKTTPQEFKWRTVLRNNKVVFVPYPSSPAIDLDPLTRRYLNLNNFNILTSLFSKKSGLTYEEITGKNLNANRPVRCPADVTGYPNRDVPSDIQLITMDNVTEEGA